LLRLQGGKLLPKFARSRKKEGGRKKKREWLAANEGASCEEREDRPAFSGSPVWQIGGGGGGFS